MTARALSAAAVALALLVACQRAPERPPVVVTPSETETPVVGGSVRVLGPAQPDTLLPFGPRSAAARRILEPVLLGAYQQQPDLTWEPQLLAEDAEVGHSPFTVTYRIAGPVHWSDGVPITAEDFVFTARLLRREAGYRLIRDAERLDRKTVRFTFRRPYGRFRQLFDPVLPAHAFTDRARWAEGPRVASGPFEFDRWEPGERVVLKRNENFWGRPAHLDEVAVEFAEKRTAARLESAALHVVSVPATTHLAQSLQRVPEVAVKTVAGPTAQVLLLDAAQPPLRARATRAAVAFALDRDALVQAQLEGLQPDARPLQSLVALRDATHYVPHFDRYRTCAAPEEPCGALPSQLRFEIGSARELRRALTARLEAAGVEVDAWSGPGANMRLVRWRWPWLHVLARRCEPACGSARRLLARAARTADAEVAAELRNAAGRVLAAQVPAVPLYQEPQLLAWRHQVAGVEQNVASGVLWNAGEWFLRP